MERRYGLKHRNKTNGIKRLAQVFIIRCNFKWMSVTVFDDSVFETRDYHTSAKVTGQQDSKKQLQTKQHSTATCSPAVFHVQFSFFNPSEEIKELHFHFPCPLAVSVTMAKRVFYPAVIKSVLLSFILMALHFSTDLSWRFGCCSDSSLALFRASEHKPRESLTKTLVVALGPCSPITKPQATKTIPKVP